MLNRCVIELSRFSAIHGSCFGIPAYTEDDEEDFTRIPTAEKQPVFLA